MVALSSCISCGTGEPKRSNTPSVSTTTTSSSGRPLGSRAPLRCLSGTPRMRDESACSVRALEAIKCRGCLSGGKKRTLTTLGSLQRNGDMEKKRSKVATEVSVSVATEVHVVSKLTVKKSIFGTIIVFKDVKVSTIIASIALIVACILFNPLFTNWPVGGDEETLTGQPTKVDRKDVAVSLSFHGVHHAKATRLVTKMALIKGTLHSSLHEVDMEAH
ncbi:hypothetical protein V6N13_028566 [Hibiscus sabdariffa]